MENVARIVLAMEQHDVAEEVMHFLDRSGHARVVATAADDRQLLEAIRQLEPDVVVGQSSLVNGAAGSLPFLAVDTRESVGALRAAIRAGAGGFFVWPGDREALSTAAGAARVGPAALDRRAIVIAARGSGRDVRGDASRAGVRAPGPGDRVDRCRSGLRRGGGGVGRAG